MESDKTTAGLTVQQTSEKTGLSVHTVRYYERIGLIPSIGRAGNGHRRYTQDDIGWLEFVKCLRSTGMPIAEMQRYVKLQKRGDASLGDRMILLEKHRERIKENIRRLEGFLERIEGKIAYYRKAAGVGNGKKVG
jgi:DNA-binding transcriptional MerR regulator